CVRDASGSGLDSW
nr:immunoglobulin heavy chain junction region [Macaca mulatta]MOX68754.1 immunoglobulin heavy chain junction region [Macaca mulatta]